jgi:hypothetical protein
VISLSNQTHICLESQYAKTEFQVLPWSKVLTFQNYLDISVQSNELNVYLKSQHVNTQFPWIFLVSSLVMLSLSYKPHLCLESQYAKTEFQVLYWSQVLTFQVYLDMSVQSNELNVYLESQHVKIKFPRIFWVLNLVMLSLSYKLHL